MSNHMDEGVVCAHIFRLPVAGPSPLLQAPSLVALKDRVEPVMVVVDPVLLASAAVRPASPPWLVAAIQEMASLPHRLEARHLYPRCGSPKHQALRASLRRTQ